VDISFDDTGFSSSNVSNNKNLRGKQCKHKKDLVEELFWIRFIKPLAK
jgi:hypothetical protein